MATNNTPILLMLILSLALVHTSNASNRGFGFTLCGCGLCDYGCTPVRHNYRDDNGGYYCSCKCECNNSTNPSPNTPENPSPESPRTPPPSSSPNVQSPPENESPEPPTPPAPQQQMSCLEAIVQIGRCFDGVYRFGQVLEDCCRVFLTNRDCGIPTFYGLPNDVVRTCGL